MSRKTIHVDDLRQKVNGMIAASYDNTPENADGRMALCTLIESVLMETGNYRGYTYLIGSSIPSARQYH